MMAYAELIVDLLLGSLTCILGFLSVTVRDYKRAILMFMGLGLVLAVVWLRLAAPDLALAEAALGSGVLGGLLIMAARGLKQAEAETIPRLKNIIATGLSVMVALVMGLVSLDLLCTDNRLLAERLTFELLGDSGVTNPVTAVLLNYRAYDTLLELAVVLAACISVFVSGPRFVITQSADQVSQRLIRRLLPVIAICACYLLWTGAKAPGGAFQAGSLLAGGIALFILIGLRFPLSIRALRWSLAVGLLAFIAVGLVSLFDAQAFFTLAPQSAGRVILAVEVAATISITAALAAVFLGGHPLRWYRHETRGEKQ